MENYLIYCSDTAVGLLNTIVSNHYETFGTFQLIIANYKRLCLHPRVYQDKSVAVY